jgi:hypothetical protein
MSDDHSHPDLTSETQSIWEQNAAWWDDKVGESLGRRGDRRDDGECDIVTQAGVHGGGTTGDEKDASRAIRL